jgi:hypothetical protein
MTFLLGELQTVCHECGEVVHVTVPFAAAESDLRLAVRACRTLTDDGDLAHTLVVESRRLGGVEMEKEKDNGNSHNTEW